MTFNKIEMTINSEKTTLFENGLFQNFDKLRRICGSRYLNINDDLLDGPQANGRGYTEIIWGDGLDPVTVILFTYDGARYVVNSDLQAVDFEAAEKLMDDEIREAVHRDLAPCSDQEFYDEYCRRNLEELGTEFNPTW